MPEPPADAVSVVIAPSLGCGESSAWVVRQAVTEAIRRAVDALRLPADRPPSVSVSIGPVEQGPYSVTTGSTMLIGQAAALSAGADVITIADTIAATICTERSILCTVAGLTDPGPRWLVELGAAVPSVPLAAVNLDRACEEVLAARTGPVLSLSVSPDLAAAAEEVLPGMLDATRREFFTYWGIPIPVIPVVVSPELRTRLMCVTLLDTPFVSTLPAGADDQGPAVDAIRATVRNIGASNVPSLLTARGTDLLLAAVARRDPRLAGALRERYDRLDVTGVLRTLVHQQLPIKNLGPILERLASLQGGLNAGGGRTLVMTPATRYWNGDPEATPSYLSLANAASPVPWQYTLKPAYATQLLQAGAPTPSGA